PDLARYRALYPPARVRPCPPARCVRHLRSDRDGRLHWKPGSLPQYRPDDGVDHLLGGPRLCLSLRRRRLGARQPMADDFRRGRRTLEARRNPPWSTLLRGAGCVAGLLAAARLLMDRAGVSEPGRATPHRVVRGGLQLADLDRHGAVRPRYLAAARRSLQPRLWYLCPLRSDRNQPLSADLPVAPFRRRAAWRRASLGLDDGICIIDAVDRAL